jgi:hypothetical protein
MAPTIWASLHRKRAGATDWEMIAESPLLDEILRLYANVPPSERDEYAMMRGTTVYSRREIDDLATQAGLDVCHRSP